MNELNNLPHSACRLLLKGKKVPQTHSSEILETSVMFEISKPDENKLNYSIAFITPSKKIIFKSPNFILINNLTNELEILKGHLEEFISNESYPSYRFEPIEPCFELKFERNPENGFNIYLWVDNANAEKECYMWDAIGLRMFSEETEVRLFIKQLDFAIQELNLGKSFNY